MEEKKLEPQKPTPAFIGASWLALIIGMGTYLVGLWNANMMLNEKGYYLTLLLYGIFAVISVQKSVRDRAEGIQVTPVYYGVAWASVLAVLLLLAIGLWNAELLLSEKGFYGVAMVMAMFAATAVQKNVRDMAAFKELEDEEKAQTRAPFASRFLQSPDSSTPAE